MKTDSSRFAGFPLFHAWRLLVIVCLAIVCLGSACVMNCLAQDSSPQAADPKAGQRDALTTENLIGNAVSLANRDYPDIDSAIQRFRNGDVQGATDYLKQAKEK